MRRRLGRLVRERVKIQHLRIGINRRNPVLVGFRLNVGKRVVAFLDLNQRIAHAWPILAIARQRVHHAPVIVQRFVARFAIGFARKCHVAAIGKKREQLGARCASSIA